MKTRWFANKEVCYARMERTIGSLRKNADSLTRCYTLCLVSAQIVIGLMLGGVAVIA